MTLLSHPHIWKEIPVLDTPRPGDESIHDTLMVRSPQAKVGSEFAPSTAQVSALPTWSAFKLELSLLHSC